MDKIKFSIESYDTLLGFNRPNGTSETWNLKESNEMTMLHTLPKDYFRYGTHSSDLLTDLKSQEYIEIKDIVESKHLYVIKVLTPTYFYSNINSGFKVISEKVLQDIRDGRCILVLDLTKEVSYVKNNHLMYDLINRWSNEVNIHGNKVAVLFGGRVDRQYLQSKEYTSLYYEIKDYSASTEILNSLYATL
tara:strand:+ start:146 stop:718 length:573 start_codon:yes stop_codon:yes gene_type:complete